MTIPLPLASFTTIFILLNTVGLCFTGYTMLHPEFQAPFQTDFFAASSLISPSAQLLLHLVQEISIISISISILRGVNSARYLFVFVFAMRLLRAIMADPPQTQMEIGFWFGVMVIAFFVLFSGSAGAFFAHATREAESSR
jgi:hypothetical protein